jgi:hypothetical protein
MTAFFARLHKKFAEQCKPSNRFLRHFSFAMPMIESCNCCVRNDGVVIHMTSAATMRGRMSFNKHKYMGTFFELQ